MIDLKAARADADRWRAALARKSAADEFDELLAADERWRSLIPRVDELRGQTKLKGKPTPEELEALRPVKAALKEAEEELAAAEAVRDAALALVPNPPDDSAPDGDSEDDAEELRRVGEPPALAEAREHTEIGRFDMERAARVSGARFGYVMGDAARVAMALYQFALDHLAEAGFTPVIPPVLVREEAMYGTGFFPTERSNIYALEADGLFLTGTSEVALAALHMGEILPELPLRYTGFSTCFRREAGAAGQGHARDVPRPPVQQGGDVRLRRAGDVVGRARAHARPGGAVPPGARPPVSRHERGGRGPRRARGEEVRHRGVVPVPGALPRGHVVLEHDGLPGDGVSGSATERKAASRTRTR